MHHSVHRSPRPTATSVLTAGSVLLIVLAILLTPAWTAPAAAQAAPANDATAAMSPAEHFAVRREAERLAAAGDYAAAVPLYKRLVADQPDDGHLLFELGSALFRSGQAAEAMRYGIEGFEMGFGPESRVAYDLARGMAGAGQKEPALAWLERALDAGFEDSASLRDEPAFAALRDDPRFKELAGIPPEGLSRQAGWSFDLDYLLAEARRLHAATPSPARQPEFAAAVEALKGRIGELSDAAMAIEVQRLLAMLGDGHTGIRPGPGKIHFAVLPVRFYFFSDGLFIIDASDEHRGLVGRRVSAIGGVAVDGIRQRLAPYVSRDNHQGLSSQGAWMLGLPVVLQAIGHGDSEDSATLTLAQSGGGETTVTLQAGGRHFHGPLPPQGDPPPPWLERTDRTYWFQPIDRLDALYVQMNQVRDDPERPIPRFADELGAALAKGDRSTLIFDVRHNGGGNNYLIWPLVRRFIAHLEASDDHRLFVITSRHTFSACQNLINFLERMADPIFVGEPSGSSPNFVGETTSVKLPHSQLGLSISSRYWQDSVAGDRRPYISPQLPAPLSSDDYFGGRDPALAAIAAVLAADEGAGRQSAGAP